ncbi:750_t:CDS:2 [Scutellospora calospora]|uniref:750_t:CDS:1 n=1 Tax=Scutellospora calospora TaxID=85575 RepID=A0ACA9LLR3_9GLOM|nr:750_t:CDS:2 [Scutellospora calospora]
MEFSNICACCYKQKKRCKRKGEYREDQFPQCANCKVTMKDPPIEYNFIEEDGKVYLDFGDEFKFEISLALSAVSSIYVPPVPIIFTNSVTQSGYLSQYYTLPVANSVYNNGDENLSDYFVFNEENVIYNDNM